MINYITVNADSIMQIFNINERFTNIPKLKTPISLCLGYFDGVHIAHQKLINAALINSDNQVGIITFAKNIKNRKNLTSLENRLNLFKSLKVDYVFVLPFSKLVKSLSHVKFKELFFDQLNIKTLYAGNDFTFGKDKKGDIKYLKKYFDVCAVKFVKHENKKISSYEIAHLIEEGNIALANHLLGRNYEIKGKVIKGYQMGRKLEYPTANIKINSEYIVPRYGVYKVITYVLGIPRLGIANVGVHPTVNKLSTPILEVYIPSLNKNIYNREIYISFIKFIRPEKKFKSLMELKKQINKDLKELKE